MNAREIDDAVTGNTNIDAESIVIGLPRHGRISVSGGLRTIGTGRYRTNPAVADDEPVLAD